MLADGIRKAVEESGYKQKYVAEKIGISEQTLCAMMKGNRKIGVDEFFDLCKLLRKSPEELYHYGDQPA